MANAPAHSAISTPLLIASSILLTAAAFVSDRYDLQLHRIAMVLLPFGILCAVLAPSRGRSPFNWLLIGTFCTLFAVVAILALPKLERSATDPTES